nr:PH108-56(+3) [Vibrio phage 1]
MLQRLQEARDAGRFGWWDKSVCSIEDLYKMRHKALKDKDHVSVINFTAMIAARESE